MAIESLRTILEEASKKGYAIGCFNALNLEMARGLIAAAERHNTPIILSHAQAHDGYTPLETIGPILQREGQKAKIPVAVMLDHGTEYTEIVKAMQCGFNAVMVDASHYDFDTNVDMTKEIVKIAHALDISVEAELGNMPRREVGGAIEVKSEQPLNSQKGFTEPDEAFQFVKKTGVDALAIAFGTMHGIYTEKPHLDFKRVALIREHLEIPLVMHGSSGLSKQDIQQAIICGISKINYYSNMSLEVGCSIRQKCVQKKELYAHDILEWMRQLYEDNAYQVIEQFKNGRQP